MSVRTLDGPVVEMYLVGSNVGLDHFLCCIDVG